MAEVEIHTLPEKPIGVVGTTHDISRKEDPIAEHLKPIMHGDIHNATVQMVGSWWPQPLNRSNLYTGDPYVNMEVRIRKGPGKSFDGIIRGTNTNKDGETFASVHTYTRSNNALHSYKLKDLREIKYVKLANTRRDNTYMDYRTGLSPAEVLLLSPQKYHDLVKERRPRGQAVARSTTPTNDIPPPTGPDPSGAWDPSSRTPEHVTTTVAPPTPIKAKGKNDAITRHMNAHED